MTLATYFHTPEQVMGFLIGEVSNGKSVLVTGNTGVGKTTLTNILRNKTGKQSLSKDNLLEEDEVRGEEAYTVILKALSGKQVIDNYHSNGDYGSLTTFSDMVMEHEDWGKDAELTDGEVTLAFDYIVCLNRLGELRFIEDIISLDSKDGNLGMKKIFSQTIKIDLP